MTVTTDTIHHVAKLSRLHIDEKDIPKYVHNLNSLLKLVDQMQKIDTANIEPMAHPQANLQQRLREDKISETNQRERFQSIAPKVAEGLYIVSKVIE